MPDIVIYTRDFCGFCARAKSLLDAKGLAYEEKDATYEPALRQEMMQRSGRTTFPQIFVGDTHVGGCDDLVASERDGRLDALLRQDAAS